MGSSSRFYCIGIMCKTYFILNIFGVWNGLIGFTLFLMVIITSVFKHFGFQLTFWNGLWTNTEVPMYVLIYEMSL